jgi:uncharacterized protein (DUF2461 family)
VGLKKGDSRKQARKRIWLNEKFVDALLEDFEKEGIGAIRIMRMEEPARYCAMIASLLPREFEISHDNKLSELPDHEIDKLIDRLNNVFVERVASSSERVERREDEALN